MARNKNSTALFDVIHSAKKPPKGSVSASIPTPRWWGKNRSATELAAAEKPENAGRQQSWLAAAKKNNAAVGTVPAPVLPPVESPVTPPTVAEIYTPPVYEEVAAEPPAYEPQPEPAVIAPPSAPKVRFADRFRNRAPKPVETAAVVVPEPLPPLPEFPDPTEQAITPAPEMKPTRRVRDDPDAPVAIDRSKREVQFRLSYGGIVAIGFILLMILAIAVIAGKQMSSNDTAISDDSPPHKTATQTPSGDTTAGMMAAVAPAKHANTDAPTQPDVLTVTAHSAKLAAAISAGPAAAPAPLPIKPTRDIGMMYVVVQSYADEETAAKACSFCIKSGVQCSLVRGLTDWAPHDWYSVVGLQPFTRHDPNLAEYERNLTVLGMKFTNKVLNQFQPQAYTWRENSEDQQP